MVSTHTQNIASSFEGGHFLQNQYKGKILSMELTSHVKPAEKPESVRTYSPEEEATFTQMVNDGSFVEEIAEALGKSVNSIRVKLLAYLEVAILTLYLSKKKLKVHLKLIL